MTLGHIWERKDAKKTIKGFKISWPEAGSLKVQKFYQHMMERNLMS